MKALGYCCASDSGSTAPTSRAERAWVSAGAHPRGLPGRRGGDSCGYGARPPGTARWPAPGGTGHREWIRC